MLRFLKDTRRYASYIFHSTKSDLKNEVANSYLNWIWWFVDPLLFMIIYSFVFGVVLNRGSVGVPFPLFVFVGLTIWNYFLKTVQHSTRIVRGNRSIVTKVYLPKFVLIYTTILEGLFKFAISLSLAFMLMIFYKQPFTVYALHIIPIILMFTVLIFGISTILLNIGVYVNDIFNLVQAALRLTFYLSGIFYSIRAAFSTERLAPYMTLFLKLNPAAFTIDAVREALLFQNTPDYKIICAWFGVGVVLSVIGVATIYHNENNYVKII